MQYIFVAVTQSWKGDIMDLGLSGKTVLVTAGSQGLGRACAAAFAKEGAKVVICGRSQSALDDAMNEVPGGRAYQADVSSADAIDAMMAQISQDLGGIDVLVNNAGGPPPGPFDVLDDSDWQIAMDLTLMSAVRFTRHVLPHMRKQKWGRILTISSYGVKQPVPNLTLSNSLRMAVLGWSKTLAGQVASDNVLVNTLCPGWTKTQRVTSLLSQKAKAAGTTLEAEEAAIVSGIPLGRLGQPRELANLAVFLASEAASYITGSAIAVDGGLVEGY